MPAFCGLPMRFQDEARESGTAAGQDAPAAPFCERHYTVQEIAFAWSLSSDSVRGVFEHEPGVLVLQKSSTRGKRPYATLRIPESVMKRVHRRLCNPDLTGGRKRK
jgi:hypothetical protein